MKDYARKNGYYRLTLHVWECNPNARAFYDAMGICTTPVVIDENGVGAFRTEGRSVSVWVRKNAFEDIIINE